MGIFDKLFGDKINNQKSIKIDFTKNGIVINGQNNQLPLKISILNSIFGLPEEVKTETNTIYIWQDKGIRGFSKDKEYISEFDIQLIKVSQNQFFPQQPFLGILKIEGTDYKDFVKITDTDYLFKEYKIGNSEIQIRLTKDEVKLIHSISINIEEEKVLANKETYELKKYREKKSNFLISISNLRLSKS